MYGGTPSQQAYREVDADLTEKSAHRGLGLHLSVGRLSLTT